MAVKNVTDITLMQIAAFAVISAVCVRSLYADQDPQNAVHRFEERVAEHVERRGAAVSAAVVYAGDVIWAESFGWADVEQRTRTRIQPIIPTGSFSASLTVALLAMLDEQGVVQIDDPVIDYVPEFSRVRGPPAYVNVITLRQLANHTSGLMPTPPLPYSVPGANELWTARILSFIADTPLYSAPGEQVTYSGVGLGVLAVALARASGMPYSDLAEVLLFRPLSLSSTSFGLTPATARFSGSSHPSGIVHGDRPGTPHHRARGSVALEAPGLFTTAEDLARILAALFGAGRPQLLSTYGRSTVLHLLAASQQQVEYDAGLILDSSAGAERIVARGEALSGHSVLTIFSPDDDAGVILLANHRDALNDVAGVAASLLDELVAQGIDSRSRARHDTSDLVVWAIADVEQRPVQRSCAFPKPSGYAGGSAGAGGRGNGSDGTNGGMHFASADGKAHVTLEFIVGPDGRPEFGSFFVVAASNQRYEDSAVDWAFSCKFSPGKVDGKPVRVLVRQTVVF